MRISVNEKAPPAGGFPLGLTPAQRKEARSVLAAYGDFWTQLRFRKGWAEPPFSREDVLPMLERASEVVACIRSELDKRDQGFKLRMIDGSAREFLHGCDYVPQEQPDRFTVDLVHATLQDGRGYVEGLSREAVDQAIVQISQGLLDPTLARGSRTLPQATPTPTPTPAAGASGSVGGNEKEGVVQEGGGLVRTSSVVREEGPITQGLLSEWGGLTDEMLPLLKGVREGWGSGSDKKLLLLRRLLVDLQNTHAHLRDLTALRKEEEEREGERGQQQAAAQAGTGDAQEEGEGTQGTTQEGEATECLAEPVEGEKEDQPQPQPQGSDQGPREGEGEGEGEEDMVVLEPTPPTLEEEQDQEEEEEEEKDTAAAAAQDEGEGEDDEAAGMPLATDNEEEEEGMKGMEEEEEEEEERKKEGAVEIQKVAEDVESLRDQIQHLSACLQDFPPPSPSPSPSPSCVPSEAVLEALQGRCAKFSQALLQGLDVLDDLQVDEHDKPRRKNQVMQIQQLIDDVEGMREKLRALRQQCNNNKPTHPPPPSATPQQDEEEEEGEEEEASESLEPSGMSMPVWLREPVGSVSGSVSLKQLAQALHPLWRRMKLRPRIQAQRHNTAYVLQSFIPGMSVSDVKVSIGPHATLTLQGFRAPSLKELDALRRTLHPQAPVEAILQAGADRFGSFVETRRLPEDANLEGLEATYEGGVLRVTVPRLYAPPMPVRRPQPHPFAAARGGYPYGHRGGAGFWGDPDVWW